MAGATRWWSKETVAVVTGSNTGIGYEIVRQLASKGLTTVLTARDEGRGREAVAKLKHEGLNVDFHPLDVHSEDSARDLAQWLRQTYGGLDILVNNAGIALRAINPDNVDITLQTNYFGVKRVTKALLPHFRHSPAGAHIVINTSRAGLLKVFNNKFGEEFRDRDNLTEEKIDSFVNTYVEQVKNGSWEKGGWPTRNTTYSISKFAANAYVTVLDRELSQRPEGQKIYVNSFCPGFTKTFLTEMNGSDNIAGNVQTCLWLALMPPGGPSGKFWVEHKEVGWY